MSEPRQPRVYTWQSSIVVAVVGTLLAVGLIVLFTELVDWVNEFWAQVIYFTAVTGAVVALAARSRRKDEADPARLGNAADPITPAGLPD